MAHKKSNPKSIIFIHEGYTEIEFYNKIFDIYLPKNNVRMYKYNLKGIGNNLNRKVKNKLDWFLSEKAKNHEKEIYVFCAFDREGTREIEPLLNIDKIRKEFLSKKSRIRQIEQIIATQDIESWFFHDLGGIYDFLKVPSKERNLKIHNVEKTNNKILAQLMRKHGRNYNKRGQRVKDFIDSLDINLIYNNSKDLKAGIEKLIKIVNK